MTKNLSAVGFKSIEKRRKELTEILRRITLTPDDCFRHRNLVEQYGYTGDDYGIIIYGTKREDDSVKVRRWNTFARSEEPVDLCGVSFERFGNGDVFCYCEDTRTAQEFEFRLNNVTEYNDFTRKYGHGREISRCAANVAGLGDIGNIIFPVEKDDEFVRVRDEQMSVRRELLRRIREGHDEAESEFFEHSARVAENIRERLRTEDVLSVFEGYLIPFGEHDGSFAVLGDILSVRSPRNRITREMVYSLKLSVTGITLNVLINARDLVGLPLAGMRFMGIVSLQGTLDFKDFEF